MIMGHSKHKLSRKNMLYSLKKLSYNTPSLPHNSSHLSTMATFFCPQGGHCGKVQLYFKFSGKPCRQTSKFWKCLRIILYKNIFT